MIKSGKSKKEKSYSDTRSEIAESAAKEKGCVVVKPGPRDLFVDIDTEEQLENFEKCFEILTRSVQGIRMVMRPSPSGEKGRFHAYVTMPYDLTSKDRILFQAILGSDPVRECLSYVRLVCGDENPTLFFEKSKVMS